MAKFEKISDCGSGGAGGSVSGGGDGGGNSSTDGDSGGGSGGDTSTGGGSGGDGGGGDISTGGGGGGGGGDASTAGGGGASTGGGGDGGVVAEKKGKKTRKRKTYSGYIIVMVIWFVLLETVKPPQGLFSGVVEPELWVIWGSPSCMFFLLNIIIVILALRSGMFSNAASQNGGLDFYSEFIKKSAERRAKYETGSPVTGGAGKNWRSQSGKTKSQNAWMCSRSDRPAKNTLEGRCKGGGCGL
ncbi:hypothetical protein SUGI_0802170 [Cryptomeria japonica]|uniref:uncharacterized protein LOC131079632 n=1 Tax=Cryptomeria japonica TaxID=3369 RepID=UPI002414AA82|nr:uncharacterized protein LOC131079632 [Cryptomeria japonica]GLJ39308.1 hypothetical protein SUGI_0802170 [Cryptomeria japonica]